MENLLSSLILIDDWGFTENMNSKPSFTFLTKSTFLRIYLFYLIYFLLLDQFLPFEDSL